MAIEFTLKKDYGESLRLPVPPPSFELKKGTKITTIDVNSVGEIGLIGKGLLASITIESFFPAQDYSFVQYRPFPFPNSCVNIIEDWRESGEPIRLIIPQCNINMTFAIVSFTYGIQNGSSDIYFTLELQEYRTLTTKTSNSTTRPNPPSTPPASGNSQRTHKVVSGDTLWEISKKYYGTGTKWETIANKNGIKDPKKLQIGTVLVIP